MHDDAARLDPLRARRARKGRAGEVVRKGIKKQVLCNVPARLE